MSPSGCELSSDWINIVSHMKYVKTLFLDLTEIVRKASPNGAKDHSQGIHPLVNVVKYNCQSPNGAKDYSQGIHPLVNNAKFALAPTGRQKMCVPNLV